MIIKFLATACSGLIVGLYFFGIKVFIDVKREHYKNSTKWVESFRSNVGGIGNWIALYFFIISTVVLIFSLIISLIWVRFF
ncbi:MAG: hypothetical protein WC827_02305 [Candidatus Paceibacterota bacterium]|jgi:hypothetical protein